jgi:hypothetical protein
MADPLHAPQVADERVHRDTLASQLAIGLLANISRGRSSCFQASSKAVSGRNTTGPIPFPHSSGRGIRTRT